MAKIVVVDDDVNFCETMESLIRRMGHECLKAHTIKAGLQLIEIQEIDLVLLDVHLPDGNGLDYLEQIREMDAFPPEIIIITGLGDPDGAELAIEEGVWDYLVKPSSIKQTKLSLDRALKYRDGKRNQVTPVSLNLEKIIGNAPSIKSCFNMIAKASRSNAPVLINGETGTGKELFASTIHQNSERINNKFVVVDCASLTENLLESTLFGHKKGAFTGADTEKQGLIKLADGGTLFLDEVGDMPLSTQKSFLRVIQEKKFRPVGDNKEVHSNFRVIAATHRNLEKMVKQGEFRQDLFFRLCAIRLIIPPLRNRLEDIKLLVIFYLNKLCEEYDVNNKGFEPNLIDVLKGHHWPGNVRELFNVMEMAFAASEQENTLFAMHLPKELRIKITKAVIQKQQQVNEGDITSDQKNKNIFPLENKITDDSGNPLCLKDYKNRQETDYLTQLIKMTNGNISEILKISELSKSHFYGLIKKYEISITR